VIRIQINKKDVKRVVREAKRGDIIKKKEKKRIGISMQE